MTPLADPGNKKPEDQIGVQFFEPLKDATIVGSYTSQPGLEQDLHYRGEDYHTQFLGACTHPETTSEAKIAWQIQAGKAAGRIKEKARVRD